MESDITAQGNQDINFPPPNRPYRYSPLPDGFIRLLRVMPDRDSNAPIRCRIFEYPLQGWTQATHLYEALSYVWGSPDNPKVIEVQPEDHSLSAAAAHNLLVTENLHTALSNLRDGFLERIIWIDAICINQADDDEKGQQIQLMAKIYASANRVVVWLGEAADDSDQALAALRTAAQKQHDRSAIEKPDRRRFQQPVLNLLKRPWFERIWVLQEVAAAQQILIKCGHSEIDGYAFCVGLTVFDLSYDESPELQGLIPPITYLIQGATFRRGQQIKQHNSGFSLGIRPLCELVDMYHGRQSTVRLDKFYALLGMSSDSPVNFMANYQIPWKDIFQVYIQSCFSNQMSVVTWNELNVAVIRGKALVLAYVGSVERDVTHGDLQRLEFRWRDEVWKSGEKWDSTSYVKKHSLAISAKPVQEGDILCLLQGATTPTIVRRLDSCMAVIVLAASLPFLSSTGNWPECFRSCSSGRVRPAECALVWDLDASHRDPSVSEYGRFLSGLGDVEQQPQTNTDRAITLWNLAAFTHGMGKYRTATGLLRQAVRLYSQEQKSMDLGSTPLPLASTANEVLTALDCFVGARLDSRRSWLRWAARTGNELVTKLLLEAGADTEGGEDDIAHTPLFYAVCHGHSGVVRLLLQHGAAFGGGRLASLLMRLVFNSIWNEAVVRELVGWNPDVTNEALSIVTGHNLEGVAKLLLDRSADIEAVGSRGCPLLARAVQWAGSLS
ncbi:heterokaryon incompatibility protein-domain-containing protein [Echria macrotheca]|uniref:Heterokaryon incompatibility protein-domain-containing protein n=1 Tax=Echria macrotheca TaxID=438768 RepID=A0AAJ0F7D0_9PEZI|nr:heterokaryon incompatibility protein-domain-containing protein [Echria macrotheca]